MSFSAIAALALKVGPAAIRGISSLFGGSDTAEQVAGIVEQTKNLLIPESDKLRTIESELAKLPPDSIVELERIKVEMERVYNERLQLQLGDRQAEHSETQTTIRHSDNAQDVFVRRARPLIAVSSAFAGFLYVIVMAALQALGKGTGPDMATVAVLLGLAGTFMGLRHAEKKGGIAS